MGRPFRAGYRASWVGFVVSHPFRKVSRSGFFGFAQKKGWAPGTPSRNHARRMSHTITTITIIVPTKPKPNISPPGVHIGHQGHPCRHDRPDSGCRLVKTSQYHRSSKWEMGSVICALSDLLCLHYRQSVSYHLGNYSERAKFAYKNRYRKVGFWKVFGALRAVLGESSQAGSEEKQPQIFRLPSSSRCSESGR